jgi:hypothetical protein
MNRRIFSSLLSLFLQTDRPSALKKNFESYWLKRPNRAIGFMLLTGLLTIYLWQLLVVNVAAYAPTPETPLIKPETMVGLSPLSPGTTTITFTTVTDYLPNPGIGWQEMAILDTPLLPETVFYHRSRYNWRQQNPQANTFDWTTVDTDLQNAVAQGKQYSFRIYTMQGEIYSGHKVPQWVLDRGAVILPNGEPDYSNCVYQEEWAKFVEVMRQRYDGHTDIAFIDISGYGDFNEWSWRDDQTDTDESSLDAQARQRLADMFIGGQGTIQCRLANNQSQTVTYDYPGFQHTQLLMPYAGIRQSSRYVAGRRSDVGIRHDCLGSVSHTDTMMSKIGDVIEQTWPNAPIVYEFCPGQTSDVGYMAAANDILRRTHGSIVHDNLRGERSAAPVIDLLRYAGYRFAPTQATYTSEAGAGDMLDLSLTWINAGYAPTYPRMGQDFELHVYLTGADQSVLQDWPIAANIAGWLPAPAPSETPPQYQLQQPLQLPPSLSAGTYSLKMAIIEKRTGRSINLAIAGRDGQGRYPLGQIDLLAGATATPPATETPLPSPTLEPTTEPTATATIEPTSTPLPSPTLESTTEPTLTPLPTSSPAATATLTPEPIATTKPLVTPTTGPGIASTVTAPHKFYNIFLPLVVWD